MHIPPKDMELRNRRWFGLGGRHGMTNRIADFGPVLDRLELSSMTAVDIGAAEGDIAQWLSGRFSFVQAHELMEQAYSQLVERFESVEHVSTHQTDITQFPLTESHGAVFLLGVLHYFSSEELRQKILTHCLESTEHLFIVRTGIRDFRQRDDRRMELAHRYTSLQTFLKSASESFDLCVIDNGYRWTDDLRLGDLVVYKRRHTGGVLPELSEMFGSTTGYLNRDQVEQAICCEPLDPSETQQ